MGFKPSLINRVRRQSVRPTAGLWDGVAGFWSVVSRRTCFTDLAGTIPADFGDPVALWKDLSPHQNHAAQPTVAWRPILSRTPSGRPTLLFDGVDDVLETPPVVWPGNESFIGASCDKPNSATSARIPIGVWASDLADLNLVAFFTVANGTTINAARGATRASPRGAELATAQVDLPDVVTPLGELAVAYVSRDGVAADTLDINPWGYNSITANNDGGDISLAGSPIYIGAMFHPVQQAHLYHWPGTITAVCIRASSVSPARATRAKHYFERILGLS